MVDIKSQGIDEHIFRHWTQFPSRYVYKTVVEDRNGFSAYNFPQTDWIVQR